MDSGQIANHAQQHPERLRALEQRAIDEATRPLAQALTAAQAEAVTRWIRETIGRQIPDRLDDFINWVRDLIRRAFTGRSPQAQAAADRAAFNSAQASARQAAALAAAMSGQPVPPAIVDTGADARTATATIPTAIHEEQTRALALLTTAWLTAMGLAGLKSAFKRARQAVGRIARATATAVGSAAAHAAQLVARTLGPDIRLLWVTEAGACAACRAYAGHHIRPGGTFQGGLSLDPQRTVFATAISGPPRHPHCRCTVIPWSPSWPITGTPLPTLLRRRARTNRRL